MNTVDIAPTTLGLCGIEVPDEMPGFDYGRHVLTDVETDRLSGEPDAAFLQHLVPKLHRDTMSCTWRGVVTRDRWKYFCTENCSLGMYDLNDDPYEQNNLAFKENHREKREELLARLRQWVAETEDEYALP